MPFSLTAISRVLCRYISPLFIAYHQHILRPGARYIIWKATASFYEVEQVSAASQWHILRNTSAFACMTLILLSRDKPQSPLVACFTLRRYTIEESHDYTSLPAGALPTSWVLLPQSFAIYMAMIAAAGLATDYQYLFYGIIGYRILLLFTSHFRRLLPAGLDGRYSQPHKILLYFLPHYFILQHAPWSRLTKRRDDVDATLPAKKNRLMTDSAPTAAPSRTTMHGPVFAGITARYQLPPSFILSHIDRAAE